MDLSNLKYFVLFIGHGRSGHSLVGVVLNSHPYMVIANEIDILRRYGIKQENLKKIYSAVLRKGPHIWQPLRNKKRTWEWLGKYKELKVMGTNLGGGTESYFRKNYGHLAKLKGILPVPLKFIHVKRNMYDNITTILKKGGPKFGFSGLDDAIDAYFAGIPTIERVRKEEDVLEIKHESFVSDPKSLIIKACKFLDMNASDDYLDFCESIVWKKPRITRHTVEWKDKHIKRVEKLKNEVDFLKDYTFEN